MGDHVSDLISDMLPESGIGICVLISEYSMKQRFSSPIFDRIDMKRSG
jgi:hypothetical protein